MNVQMPFSGPFFPEVGSRPSLSKFSGFALDDKTCFEEEPLALLENDRILIKILR